MDGGDGGERVEGTRSRAWVTWGRTGPGCVEDVNESVNESGSGRTQ